MKKEFSSTSLKDALMQAAGEFNVNEDSVKYEIITEKTKYFGFKKREIHITAWPDDGSEAAELSIFVKEMIKLMGLDLDFSLTDGKGFVAVNFKGEDYKLLLYKNGNLLNAIQYLLNRLYSEVVGKKIYCESENFRKKREQELSKIAHQHAKRIRKNGRSVIVKELNPFERRVVHMIINKYSDLESSSAGDNFHKTITIRKR
ncbi:MAG: R3H domain-containing nucleic acid-binding protein [Acidobacteriota bacterium]